MDRYSPFQKVELNFALPTSLQACARLLQFPKNRVRKANNSNFIVDKSGGCYLNHVMLFPVMFGG